ncbi:MAG: hypothetical protein ACOX68_03500 [Candidatus Limivicinus sp.]
MAASKAICSDVKLVLHVPHFSWCGKLTENQHVAFLRYLRAELGAAGFTAFYSVPATGFYSGRSYAEELVTVFCAEDKKEHIIKIFEAAYRTHNDLLQQEAFAYECGGMLFTEELS